MRNLLEGWCPRGPSIDEAARALRTPVIRWWESAEFADCPSDDWRAALYAWVLTGHTPERRDTKGAGDGLADLLLRPEESEPQPLEVLSTIDPVHKAAVPHALALIDELNGDDPPPRLIPVSLGRGWKPPLTKQDAATRRRWRAAVQRARHDAQAGDLSTDTVAELQAVFPGLQFGQWVGEMERGGFEVSSWNAAVAPSNGVPYLDRLSNYLATDRQALRHVDKLRREAVTLGAKRTHLFLLVASTGARGNLLPTSPSWFTEGTFTAPAGLTDLWMDGATGYLMRWQQESGWTYHETEKPDAYAPHTIHA